MNKYDINFKGYSTKVIDPCFIIVHHTAGPKDQSVESIKAYHVSKGWGDIAYHWLIDSKGNVKKGRQETKIGTHAPGKGMNFRSIGICMIGNYENEVPTNEQLIGLAKIIDEVCTRYKIPPQNVLGHKDVDSTLCPGRNLYSKIRYINVSRPSTSPTIHSQPAPSIRHEVDDIVDSTLVEDSTVSVNSQAVLSSLPIPTYKKDVIDYGNRVSALLPKDTLPQSVKDHIVAHDGKETLERVEKYFPLIKKISDQYNVDPIVALTIAYQETRVRPGLKNAQSGAYGMFQVKPSSTNVPMDTVEGEITAGVKYIKWICVAYNIDDRDWVGIYGRYAAGPTGFTEKAESDSWWKDVLGEAVKLIVDVFIPGGDNLY